MAQSTLYPAPRYGTYTVADDEKQARSRNSVASWGATSSSTQKMGSTGGPQGAQTEAELVDWLHAFHERIQQKAVASDAIDQRRREAAARDAERWEEVKKAAAEDEERARVARVRADEEARQAAESAAADEEHRNKVEWICRDMTMEQRQAWEADQAELDALEGLIHHHESRLNKYAAFANTEYQQYMDRVAAEEAAAAATRREEELRARAESDVQQFALWTIETEHAFEHACLVREEAFLRLPLAIAAEQSRIRATDAARIRCFLALSEADQRAIDAMPDHEARQRVLDDFVEMACLKAATQRASRRAR